MRAAPARSGTVALVLLVLLLSLVLCGLVLLALCSILVPAAAGPVARPEVVGHAAVTTVLTHSTSVPGNSKKGVKLGSVLWAVLAVAVLAAAVATPLALRRHRERTARKRTPDDS